MPFGDVAKTAIVFLVDRLELVAKALIAEVSPAAEWPSSAQGAQAVLPKRTQVPGRKALAVELPDVG